MNGSGLSLPPLLGVPGDVLGDPALGSRYEWIEPDGEGGWAAGSAVWANTRREHGLLVVARPDVGDRFVLLSRFEETLLTAEGERFPLGCNFYPGAVHPQGHLHLRGFSLDPWPVWRYTFGERELVREVFRSRRGGALLVRYRLGGGTATLELRPLFAGRSSTSLVTANDLTILAADASEGLVAYRPYEDAPAAVLTFLEGGWTASPEWYYRNAYPNDTASGGTAQEDLFSPGILRIPLRPATPATVACGVRPARVGRVDRRLNDEIARRETLAERGRALAGDDPRLSELGARLALAADAFTPRAGTATPVPVLWPDGIVRVRDALIALPWLARVTGRTEESMGLLRVLAGRLRDGLLPARLGDGAASPDDYAAVDSPLWYIEAVGAFAAQGHSVTALLPAVRAILDAYLTGTSFDIHVGDDGLLQHGFSARPLTWMDAVTHGQPVTPRRGRAVEVNALWHNALLRAASFAPDRADAGRYTELAERARQGFDAFWWEDAGRLHDVLDATGHADRALRPNALLAVSLEHPPLAGERARRVVESIERALLVPPGIRSLAPRTEGYHGRLEASVAGREAQKHQGPAWTGWLGPYLRAYLRVHGGDRAARGRVRDLLLRCEDRLSSGVIGHVEERAAGDPPHAPDGALASAWSIAGLLEGLVALRSAEAGDLL